VVVLQSQNLLDVLNFDVLHDLVVVGFTNVEQLSTQGEDTEVVTSLNGTETGYGESLGGVTFSEDECAAARIAATGPVGIFKLGNTTDTSALRTIGLLEELILLEASPAKDILDNA
jgi:hypothetical protein